MRFEDREQAGELLATAVAEALANEVGETSQAGEVVVLALPRGGVPVAAHVAAALDAPLDVLLVRKLGAPGNPELAIGAVASGGVRVLNDTMIAQLRIPRDWLEQEVETQTRELERRARRYRGDAPATPVAGRTVVLVDDGIATGATMRAGARALRERDPTRIVVAIPTAPEDTVRMLEAEVDRVVCLDTPEPFQAVALWYEDFPQVSDEEVVGRLADAAAGGDV